MRETPDVRSVRDLVLLWGAEPMTAYESMAADLGPGYRDYQPRDWARRGRVPLEHVDAVVKAAAKRKFKFVTHEFVVMLATPTTAEQSA